MEIKLNITQRDIDLGIPCDPHLDPITSALRRRFPKVPKSEIKSMPTYAKVGDEVYVLDEEAERFVKAFDTHWACYPSFEDYAKRVQPTVLTLSEVPKCSTLSDLV